MTGSETTRWGEQERAPNQERITTLKRQRAEISLQEETTKQRIAQELIGQLQSASVELSGKSFLDVGSGYGFNAEALQNSGAKVVGVESDAEACVYAVLNGKLDERNTYCGKLQNVDIAAVFLWNIPRGEYDEVLRALSLTISQEGMVIIGLHNEVYISIDPEQYKDHPNDLDYYNPQ
jgi:SAM-dependent methyltransferase